MNEIEFGLFTKILERNTRSRKEYKLIIAEYIDLQNEHIKLLNELISTRKEKNKTIDRVLQLIAGLSFRWQYLEIEHNKTRFNIFKRIRILSEQFKNIKQREVLLSILKSEEN